MPHPSLTRHAWRAALALTAGLSAACGDPKPPPTPDPPQVSLTVPEAIVAGTALPVVVTVSGCDTVSSLNLYDRDTFLKTYPYSGGTVTVELASADIPYRTAGMAANLSLIAEAVCDDARKGRSLPQPATFFPVTRVLDDPQRGAAFNFPLAVDGTGNNVAFLGCSGPTVGTHTLYRQPLTGTAQTLAMPSLCTPETVITAPASDGTRWVWTPGFSAFAVDSSFQITSRSHPDFPVRTLTVMDNGDALIRSLSVVRVSRLSRRASTPGGVGQEHWVYQTQKIGTPIAPLKVRNGRVLISNQYQENENRAQIIVEELDAGDSNPTTGGALLDTHLIRDIISTASTPPPPAGAFSDDGSILFLGFYPVAPDRSQVVACAADADGCEGTNSRWTSTLLVGPMRGLVPYANGSRIAAVGTQRVWLLSSADGTVRSPGGASVDANGALNVLHVIPGRPPSTDITFLAGPARPAGGAATSPVEIFAADQSSSGEGREVFRFQVPVSLGAALDGDGRLWMRTGGKLMQALPTNQYRSARP
ncbi:hypothetical protein [Pyxidicoccus xibeiensis]|uniref:hypothetical protein n=1 Tax=Pyxidicoccus xibeiensis TaxID=2906759 RepID=UPI0020A7A318|nr:hypothetical protein [Pyxidicoccus xibeiensis]MCP3145290.1 hypothetical protein [Pyxidicoccus xibeiensis]